MKLIHVLAEGLLLDTLILFPVLVFGGYLLARKKPLVAATAAGTVLLGWVGVLVGLWVLVQALAGLDGLIVELFGMQRMQRADLDTQLSLPGAYKHSIVLVTLLATAVNVAWARFSAARYLFLNPIHVALGASLLLLLFYRSGASAYVAVPVTGLLIGSAMAWLPWIAVKPNKLTGKSGKFELGSLHTSLLVGLAWLAPRVGGTKKTKRKKSASELEAFLVGGVLISGLSLLLAINAGETATHNALSRIVLLQIVPSTGSGYYLVGALMLGFFFAGGFWILVSSSQHVLSGVIDSFEGWQRLLPGSVPAMDGLFMLSEAPLDAVIGFLLSFAGGVIGFHFFGWIGLTAVVPGMLVAATAGHFISGGVAGIIAARIGGTRALFILAPLHGVLLSLITAVAVSGSKTVATSASAVGTELGDLSVIAVATSWILRLFN